MKTQLLIAALSLAACGTPFPSERLCLSVDTLQHDGQAQAGLCPAGSGGAIVYRGSCTPGSTVRVGSSPDVSCVDGRWEIRGGFSSGKDGMVHLLFTSELDGLQVQVPVTTSCPTARDAQPGPSIEACSP